MTEGYRITKFGAQGTLDVSTNMGPTVQRSESPAKKLMDMICIL